MSEIGNALFEAVVAASGLSSVFGTKALARALTRAGVDPHTITRRDLEKALPALEQALGVFLRPDEAKTRLDSIAQLLRRTAV